LCHSHRKMPDLNTPALRDARIGVTESVGSREKKAGP
jgi:hypothetical protein